MQYLYVYLPQISTIYHNILNMTVDALKVVRINDFDELLGAGCISMRFFNTLLTFTVSA